MIEILNRYTQAVIYKSKSAESIKDAVAEAVLNGADLRGADLQHANLQDAYLRGAYLRGANLRGADLQCANLRGAGLRGANLQDAYFQGADLQDADLQDAYLQDANLRGAKDIPAIAAAQTTVCPQEGPLIGWKKCQHGVIIKLMIPANARRSNATGRKCRAEFADVLEVIGAEIGVSQHDGKTEYRVGQRVVPDKWCEDRWQECAGGIHFFITREEAEAY